MRLKYIILAILLASPAMAETPVRVPVEGIAILDCAPPEPAPKLSCLLRVPVGLKREEISRSAGTFKLLPADLSADLPDVALSSTLVLIDLTPGLGGERKGTWPRERALIADFLRALPGNERVALYGFNETLERLTDFGTDRAAQVAVVEALELRGTNTRIATYARDAITVLGAQDKTILRNLVVISDGEEEGTRDLTEVANAARDHGVSVSALGMLWRPIGAPENGAGMDYLAKLTEGSSGTSRAVQIRREAEAATVVAALAADLGKAISDSALIVPDGEPVAADISVVLSRPVAGTTDQVAKETVTAHFAGAPSASESQAAPEPEPELTWLDVPFMGQKRLWWLLGGAALAALLVAGLKVLLRRGNGEVAEDDNALRDLVDPAPPMPLVPAVGPALGWLVRDDTGERLAIRKPRVTIGRSATCDLVLADASVSRLHAELERTAGDRFTVTDSGSLNKTRLNGTAISQPRALTPGDTVSFGNVKLRFTQA